MIDGRYRVLRYLADGGMATVYVALDERLDREVALKIMRPDLARDEAFVDRFRREARAAARLSHPHVVAVTDQGRDANYVFLAMELVDGRTLRNVIRDEAPMPPRRALDLMDAVLDGLAAAHRAGIVHRDVKPENVLISAHGQVKVTDFGLARAVTSESITSDSDVLLGTAAYLSPEQVEYGTADERSDVYSAGLLLHELLTGEKGFPGDTPIQVAYQHVHGPVPKPSDLVPGMPAVLDDLVQLAAAKDRSDRPRNAADYLARLRAARASLTADELDRAPQRRAAATASTTDQGESPTGDAIRHTTPIHGDVHRTGRLPSATGRRPASVPSPARQTRRRTTLLAALAVAAVLLGGIGAWVFTVGPLGSTTLPRVVGTASGVAVNTLQQAGLNAQVSESFSETVPKGQVIATKPAAGAQVRKHSTVDVVVSKGVDRVTMPDLRGQTQEAATAAIARAGLKVGKVTQAFDDTVPSGQVVQSSPSVNSIVRPGSSITLTVSKGKAPIAVPDVVGQDGQAAEQTLTGLGLKVAMADQQFSDTVASGSVISQSPAGGTLHKGDTVTLTVSKGQEMVTIPDVSNQSPSDARSTLEGLGLKVKIDNVLGGFFNDVRGTDPSAGTQVPKGSEVSITVW